MIVSQSFDYQFLSIGSSAFQCSLATEGLRLRSVGGGGGRSGRLWCDGQDSTRTGGGPEVNTNTFTSHSIIVDKKKNVAWLQY